jgi:putative transposase
VLHVISLAHFAVHHARGQGAERLTVEGRLRAESERLRQELALTREENRIKDVRWALVPPRQRPHYPPAERMAILELRAVCNWNLAKTAEVYMVSSATIREWMRRVDEPGEHPLVQLREPVNKFPEFVGYVARRLKKLCPTMGKRKIAETLARAGLHLAASTVGRMLASPPPPEPAQPVKPATPRRVRATRPNEVWHCDLSIVPIVSGFWTPWPPHALPQCWPFCWWIAAIVDQFSRRIMGTATFRKQPTSEQVRAFFGRTVHAAGTMPKHLITDKGKQFDCHGFRRWCSRHGIQVRYGAVGRQGSIAVVERTIRTLKELLRMLVLIPMCAAAFRRDLQLIVDWYNAHRPHAALNGRTPNEVYFAKFPACHRPRFEPRTRWPRASPCARPWALPRGRPGARLELNVSFHNGRKHLPLISLKRAA